MKFSFFSAIGVIVIIALVLVLIFTYRNFMKSLITPGYLTVNHAKYENDCAKCHYAFNKNKQNDLCLNCHKDAAEDLNAGQGLHGKSAIVKEKQCNFCHPDHKGRKFDITSLEISSFNHALTDFALVGAHARAAVSCQTCHLPGKKYRDAPKDCLGCHAKNDIHKGQLGADCVSCHKETFWNETYFDHKKTRFPLEGKHRQADCNACHVNESYKNTPIECLACHLINGEHAGAEKNNCSQCHGVEEWKNPVYDHKKNTKFALEGRHFELKCDSCHRNNSFFNRDKTGKMCLDCHKTDDVHKGKNGAKCESCHSAVNWKQVNFEHNRDSQFKLSGRHIGLQCAVCHKDNSGKMKIGIACYICHKKNDIHKGQQGTSCELCHGDSGWKEEIKFDHDLTGFPLIGLHAVVACGECHLSSAFKDADKSCVSCHRLNDFHKETLGENCEKCHNPNGWKLWEFDHNTQSTYKLDGAHEGVECQSCHQRPMGKDVQLSSSCYSCHDDDDTHLGRFGQQCERCHSTDSFKKLVWEDK